MVRTPALLAVLAACATTYGRTERDLVFTHTSPLSSSAEVARRTMPSLAFRHLEQDLAGRQQRLVDHAIDLAGERFDLYVPPGAPPREGYGLVVYISPSSAPARIDDWRGPLDDHHVIFVAAQRSGNETSVLDRRVPLALAGYENVRARFPIDSKRVYAMGFSGGARVAEIVALAYPDVFRGAVLNAGSDPIDGKGGNHKPPAELFRAFQRSRVIFITGERDVDHLRQDQAAQDSLRDNCVLDVKVELALDRGHQAIDTFALDRVLDALEAKHPIDAGELAECNARLEARLADELAHAGAAIARGDRDGARALLAAIDDRFGGLAAQRVLELDAKLSAPN